MRDLTQSITIRGRPLNQAYPGRVFYVSNTTTASQIAKGGLPGSDSSGQGSYKRPFASIDFAVGQCVASRGDVILVMPGYAETITTLGAANSIALDVAGVAIVGLGTGTARPTITCGSAALDTATRINVTAANVSLKNLIFVAAGSADITTCFLTAAAKEFNIEHCEFRDGSSILNWKTIVTTGSVSNAADGLRFANNKVIKLSTTNTAALISILETHSRLELTDNYIRQSESASTTGAGGEFWTSAAKVLTDVLVARNVFIATGNTGKTVGIFTTSTGTINNTGVIADNYIASLDTTTELVATVGTSYGWQRNYYTGTADASGKPWPALDS
jgi:hypothetical protein